MTDLLNLLKELCEINGTSGDESRVADFITENIKPEGAVIRRDLLGNVLVFKKGKNTPNKTVMFAAHMDEVGFIITDITKDGFLRFAPVGGINAGVVFGRRVVFNHGKSEIYGVIAAQPVHLLNSKEKDTQPKIEDLLIDIGANSKEEAEEKISKGDYCYFVSEFEEIGNNQIRSKAIDNRLGCAIMLSLLSHELEYDCVFAFTVQEEIGCRGAGAAAFNLEPDICVILEATTACDTAEISQENQICRLGEGAVITFMDKGTVYDRELYKITNQTAKDNNLKFQTKNKIIGGNDASVIHTSAGGIRTIAVSAPCRYLHSPLCMANNQDISEMRVLAEKLLSKLAVL
jgi:endoglucanase